MYQRATSRSIQISMLSFTLMTLCAQKVWAQQHHWVVYNQEAHQCIDNGNIARAELSLLKAAQAAKNISPDDPRLAVSLRELGSLYIQEKKWAEAESVLKEAVAIDQKVLAATNPELTTAEKLLKQSQDQISGNSVTTNPVAMVSASVAERTTHQETSSIIKSGAAAEEMSSVKTGENHSDTKNDTGNKVTEKRDPWKECWQQGRDLYVKHDYAGAERLWRKSVALAKSNDSTAYSVNSLLLSLYAQKKFKEADSWYKKSMAIVAKTCGKNSAQFKEAVQGYAVLQEKQGKKNHQKSVASPTNQLRTRTSNHQNSFRSIFSIPFKKNAEPDASSSIGVAEPGDEEIEDESYSEKIEAEPLFPKPHEPDIVRLVSSIVGTVVGFQAAGKFAERVVTKVVPEKIEKGKIQLLSLLCWSTLIWWIIPFFGVVGSRIAREFAYRHKAKAGTFIQISEVGFVFTLVSWCGGIVYAVFFK